MSNMAAIVKLLYIRYVALGPRIIGSMSCLEENLINFRADYWALYTKLPTQYAWQIDKLPFPGEKHKCISICLKK